MHLSIILLKIKSKSSIGTELDELLKGGRDEIFGKILSFCFFSSPLKSILNVSFVLEVNGEDIQRF